MDPAGDGRLRPQSCSASVRVRELSWQGPHNPCPQSRGPDRHQDSHREQRMEEPLSPAHSALAQTDEPQEVQALEMCVDTREHSLGNLGVHLPNLNQLKLTGSRLSSLRDLGTSLGRLQVLWLARCGLTDLDGIGSFPALKELYASYNNISDLSPLCLLDQLEVLDLEGNSLEDLEQVPGCYNYRGEVKKLVPQLRVLDEVPTTYTDLPAPRQLSQDWLVVKEAIREDSMLDSDLPSLDHTHGATLQKRGLALTLAQTPPWLLSLLGPRGHLTEALRPVNLASEDHTSSLTHGN